MAVKKKEVSLNSRVALTNTVSWDLHFRGIESSQDFVIPASAKNYRRITVAELDAQVKSGNIFFCGRDGMGNYARVKIEDPDVRKFVFGIEDNEEIPEQIVLDEKSVKDLLETRPKAEFVKKLNEMVVTEAQKRMIVPLATKIGIESYETYKMQEIEKVSGMKF